MIVFFACEASTVSPETEQLLDCLMNESYSQNGLIVVHPLFDLNSQYGKFAVQYTTKPPPEAKPGSWDGIIIKDLWMLSESNFMVYDLDSNPGVHYLMAGVLHGLPIVAVSQTLKGVPPYFSPFVESVLKPGQVANYLWNRSQRETSPTTATAPSTLPSETAS